ncbi:Hpr(Ser) kinase/phosphatase [Halobacteroides halobius DSM 5150]|uniref:HPr kinase/phosphorylase n=1 Tax=Halobacteroides halobius (strain ATCC 35273 / DSM 5150 / MD-1) TaxID=748449 RepID=L0KD45_HALHC|nr:HPr(Ser) kinase/phosphatase [Halobacteroides halobius]AGB42008.1 Hpr(Ser) kinase/phosphatase [Halobacteroides halobius DSM 5150]
MKELTVQEIIDEFGLEKTNQVVVNRDVTVSDIKRPGLELAGFFDYFTPERIQILGRTEISFLKELPKELLVERVKKFVSYNIPCIVVTRGMEPPQILIDLATEAEVAILRTDYSTTSFVSRLTEYLEEKFAPEVTKHGVLVEVYGVGVFIKGSSGIGKSESALDLVKRGHRLVADDAVVMSKVMRNTLVGSSPDISEHYMELRGLGIINVKTLFGAGAIREEQHIDFIIELEEWNDKQTYDRLGLEEESQEILGVTLPKVTIPVRPGRNLAMVMEVAAMNFRLKSMGYNAAEEFTKNLNQALKDK